MKKGSCLVRKILESIQAVMPVSIKLEKDR